MTLEQPATAAATPKDASRLIYVVDDETMIGEVVELILKLEGYEPKFFSNPEAAFRSFVKETPKPALLLTDFLMSPINGMELIQRCKQADPELRAILYSGNVREDITKFYPLPPDAFLSKPFLPNALVAKVNSVLGR